MPRSSAPAAGRRAGFDRVNHRCDIVEFQRDSFPFKESFRQKKQAKAFGVVTLVSFVRRVALTLVIAVALFA